MELGPPLRQDNVSKIARLANLDLLIRELNVWISVLQVQIFMPILRLITVFFDVR